MKKLLLLALLLPSLAFGQFDRNEIITRNASATTGGPLYGLNYSITRWNQQAAAIKSALDSISSSYLPKEFDRDETVFGLRQNLNFSGFHTFTIENPSATTSDIRFRIINSDDLNDSLVVDYRLTGSYTPGFSFNSGDGLFKANLAVLGGDGGSLQVGNGIVGLGDVSLTSTSAATFNLSNKAELGFSSDFVRLNADGLEISTSDSVTLSGTGARLTNGVASIGSVLTALTTTGRWAWTPILGLANGGTGLSAVGAAGTFIRSTGSAYANSTLVLPNAATANRIALATSTNTIGEYPNLTFDGNQMAVVGSGNDQLTVTGSGTGRNGILVKTSNASGNATFYFDSDLTAFTAYGGLATAGSSVVSQFFGLARGLRTTLLHDGASGLGLMIGTLNATPVVFGANNTERLRLSSAGNFGVGAGASPHSLLHVNGSFATAYVAKTALYTLTGTDYTVEVTSGTHTQTLPTAVGIAGRTYVITNSGSGTVTVGTTSSQTFVNVTATPTTLTLNQFQTVMVQSNGANWLRISTL